MSQRIRCGICRHVIPVSEVDPDAAVSEMVDHVARAHGFDPVLSHPNVVLLEDDPDTTEPE
nr:hypothetical protein [Microbacterium bovistercoris]